VTLHITDLIVCVTVLQFSTNTIYWNFSRSLLPQGSSNCLAHIPWLQSNHCCISSCFSRRNHSHCFQESRT
jgi:hypothetical protein